MAKALQCNRCGYCFNPLTIEGEFCHFSNPAIRTKQDYKDCLSGRYFDPVSGRDGTIDLCPDCVKDFIKFMEREEV